MQRLPTSQGKNSISFPALQKHYGLKNPTSIKMRILWMAIQSMSLKIQGDKRSTRKILNKYDLQWKAVESAEENLNN